MSRADAFYMVRRRAQVKGITGQPRLSHLRATKMTDISGFGVIESAQMIAAHFSSRTDAFYVHRRDKVTHAEIEKLQLGVRSQL
jgi:hypothetical protein